MPEQPRRDDPADTVGGVVPSARAHTAPMGDPDPVSTPDPPTVHRYLLTAPSHVRMDLWAAVGMMFSNWLHTRPNGDRETWLATVFHPDAPSFLAAAEQLGVTVEEIVGAGDTEAYELRVGEPGTGWCSGAQLDPHTVGVVVEHARAAEANAPAELVRGLADELAVRDAVGEDLAAEFAALPDCHACEGTGKNRAWGRLPGGPPRPEEGNR